MLARLDPADVGLQAEAREGAGRRDGDRVQVRAGRVRPLRRTCSSRSSSAPRRSTPSATRSTPIARSTSRRRRNLAVSQNQASYATLVANEDGVVTAVNAEAGQVVTAGPVGRAARARGRARGRDQRARESHRRIEERRSARSSRCGRIRASIYRGTRARDRAGRRSGDAHVRRARRDRSIADPAVQWGMTANVGVHGASQPSAALLPLTSIYQQGRQARGVALRPGDAAGQRCGRSTIAPVPRGRRARHGRACANGDWIVAAGVHKLPPGQVVRPYEGATDRRRPPERRPRRRRWRPQLTRGVAR